ncbi:aldehyde dehydrogenase family protein [Agrobacterium sp. LAD9]|uniref:aldehyde dehydrogenase family protein n=1 Tax=Agrobacterium sp. LAD9 TaxID=2055153 RepID=UPI000D1F522D|nr:aldehyde dehydrogenase family protein [Agrobacterium sp. LAD9]
MDKRNFYINGLWTNPAHPRDASVENPATGDVIATISLGSAEDVDCAVKAATTAFPGWANTPIGERRRLVERLQEIYASRFEEMASIISVELGAPITMSREQQAAVGVGHAQAFLDALDRFQWEETLTNGDLLFREAIGVVGLITPWNWPMNQIALKVLPALLTGCTCVLKPSEVTPLSAMLYAEMIDEAGFPNGVFNLVNGNGADVGAAISRHPNISMVSFTGSTRAGTAVLHDAAATVKRVTLELGGKNPNLVFADCNVEEQVASSVFELFNNSGQSCDAPTRMLVEKSVYSRAVEVAANAANAQTIGDPLFEGPHIGPLSSKTQWQRVQSLIEAGLQDGARLVAGGAGKPDGLATGHYVRPTVFADVEPSMRIYREEIFGPVLTITPFETEAEGIAMANDTAYGLAAYIQSGDPIRVQRVARQLRAGMIHVNGAPHRYGSPFGGYGQSGNGREGGLLGLEDFTEVKTLHFPDA